MKSFAATIVKLGVNPCVDVPSTVLHALQKQSGREKGPIPVRGMLNGAAFKQTVVKYQDASRLYLNGSMLKASGLAVGDIANVQIEFDPKSRVMPINPKLKVALAKNKFAESEYEKLPPSSKLEINRYLGNLKTRESLIRNVGIVVQHLLGDGPKVLSPLFRVTPKTKH